VHERSDELTVFRRNLLFVVSQILFVSRGILNRAIRKVRFRNNRSPPHRPNNVKRAIKSRAHRNKIGYSGSADATGCNSRNFCIPAPSVSRALPRQPGRTEPSTENAKRAVLLIEPEKCVF